GYLVGVLLQPEPIPIAEWLPLVFDEQGRDTVPSDGAAKERATRLIMRRHDELASYIAAREPFDPVIFELDDDAEQPLAGHAAITDLVEAVMEVADLSRPRRPTTRGSPKVGRNDLCACGSGKKFKHCHGREVH